MDTDHLDIIAEIERAASQAWRERDRQIENTLTHYALAFDKPDLDVCCIILAAAKHDLELAERISEFHCGLDLRFE